MTESNDELEALLAQALQNEEAKAKAMEDLEKRRAEEDKD